MIEIINGDLLNAEADYICHQVNCRGVMGAGLAKTLSDQWPRVKSDYLSFCSQYSAKELLGKAQIVEVDAAPIKGVINIFGQLNYGRSRTQQYTNYMALKEAFSFLNKKLAGETLAFPRGFGCGLANGSWSVVLNLIEENFPNCAIMIYKKGDQ